MRKFLKVLALASYSLIFLANGIDAFSSDKLEEQKFSSLEHQGSNKKRKQRDCSEDTLKIEPLDKKRQKISNNEAFLPSDLPGFTKLSANQYQCNDAQFDIAFPLCDLKNVNKALGQIETLNNSLGTGTIIEIAKKSNKLKIKGITAKHVLFDDKNLPVFGKFTQGLVNAGGGAVSSLCEYTIKKILTHPDNRDIAIFEAETPFKQDLQSLLTTKIPSIVNGLSTSKKAIIYHYPMGVQEQRKNEGMIDSKGIAHLVTTLPGSSGASVLNAQKKIIGVHVSSGDQNKKKVKYNGNKLPQIKGQKFGVSDENEYISIISSDLTKFTQQYKK